MKKLKLLMVALLVALFAIGAALAPAQATSGSTSWTLPLTDGTDVSSTGW